MFETILRYLNVHKSMKPGETNLQVQRELAEEQLKFFFFFAVCFELIFFFYDLLIS